MDNNEYKLLIMPYNDAMNIMLRKLEMLNHNIYSDSLAHPVSNVQSRIKSNESIAKKLEKKGIEYTGENARNELRDIADIRVVCYFKDDIYNLVRLLKQQSDLIVICEKDYIQNPKPSGYRSYHIVLGVPVYYHDGMECFPVEVQFRTMSMDYWAAMEHRIIYKNNKSDDADIARQFLAFSEALADIEREFENM